MMTLYNNGLAPGTHRNRRRQASTYVRFMSAHNLDPSSPDQYDILQFITSLASGKISPASINNIVSGAKIWVHDMGGDTEVFDSRATARLKKGIAKAMIQPVKQAPALSPTHLQLVINFLNRMGPEASTPIAAILMAYFTFLGNRIC